MLFLWVIVMYGIKEAFAAIDAAEEHGRLIDLDISGLSGSKLIGFLQRCAQVAMKNKNACYLELGVFQGLTLTSVSAAAPDMTCFGIDNFSQFDPDRRNRLLVEQRLEDNTSGNGVLINDDFETALLSLRRYINEREVVLYFVDGPHDYRSQYISLDFVRQYLSSDAVIVVDDSNYEHVRRANNDWLRANPEFALLYEAYTPCHPGNMTDTMERAARVGWWNGVNIIVRDPGMTLVRIYPPVEDTRERYFNDHLVHPSRYAGLAPQFLDAVAAPFPIDMYKLARLLLRKKAGEKYMSMNTRSEHLKSPRKAEYAGG